MRTIVGDLKTFSREAQDPHRPVDVKRVLDSTLNLAAGEIRHRARLVKEYGQDVPPVRGSESRLGQVFLNLLLNAAQAITGGSPQENTITVRAWAEGGRVVAEIRDTGEGIPPENLERIFDPFFSTRPVGVGTGLGLAICHGIISAMHGDITVESTPGQGTCFRVLLPVAPEDEESSSG